MYNSTGWNKKYIYFITTKRHLADSALFKLKVNGFENACEIVSVQKENCESYIATLNIGDEYTDMINENLYNLHLGLKSF
jgi:hypothetical protein